jgi:hypothetical protein
MVLPFVQNRDEHGKILSVCTLQIPGTVQHQPARQKYERCSDDISI